LTGQEEKPGKDGVMIYLNASGRLDEAVGAVAANGGSVIKPKHAIGPFGYRAIVIDSEGNRVALHSE
jgi:predicted enzyme related to lactoylglutathione lyase